MQSPQLRFLPVIGPSARDGGVRRMAFWDWSADPEAQGHHVVICVHGLSRQGRDFDVLAQALTPRSRVLAVDVAGRGYSDWLADPMAYQLGNYVADLAALVLQLRAEVPDVAIDWVGTSMGGLIGMAIAAQPALAPRRLVLNDVGPVIQWAALQRIGDYLGQNPSFASEQDAVAYLASISTGFGPHSPAQWLAFSRPMLRERDGRWWLHYDPAIAQPYKAMTTGMEEAAARQFVHDGERTLWALYDAIGAPTLLLRGADSDLLTRATASEMGQRGPRARCVEFAGVGHAPTLLVPDQVAVVQEFLWAV
ncbi:MAG: alpha/beta hydrolase [Hydrogenophaga sp.]|uniref:alpha/beta fold hydrolase n=1 Tax=Hydrogenophaga sp. TaxID=1904254 RepID=UPI00271677DA|nr:alpha/beta hydrolase [Hydrogenophaga sp.]MDO9032021.1 alpha/beta hydrolase [Hydrogenophaga sp.]